MKAWWYARKTTLITGWLVRDWIHSPRYRFFFSCSDWEPFIRRYMKWTRHGIVFGELADREASLADMVVPLTLDDVYFIARNPLRFPNNRLPVAREEVINLFNDKGQFDEWLRHSRFSDLATAAPKSPPFFLKPKVGAWGERCHAIRDQADLSRHAELLESGEYIRQEILISPREWATHLLVDNGKIRHVLCIEYRFEKEVPIKGKDLAKSITVASDPFLDTWRDLMEETDYSGICCINYKIVEGRPVLMEVNPRFGGSLAEYFFSFAVDLPRD